MLPEVSILGELNIIEVIIYYDFPRVFICENGNKEIYLSISTEESDEDFKFIYIPISITRLEDIKNKNISLKDAIKSSENGYVYLITIPVASGESSKKQIVYSSDIPEEWLPSCKN